MVSLSRIVILLATILSIKALCNAFSCDDGKTTLSYNSINDDYCDCLDHSDEPNTSACSRGKFQCINEDKLIPSSRVDDTVCDCCDGSDEKYSRLNCPYKCNVPDRRQGVQTNEKVYRYIDNNNPISKMEKNIEIPSLDNLSNKLEQIKHKSNKRHKPKTLQEIRFEAYNNRPPFQDYSNSRKLMLAIPVVLFILIFCVIINKLSLMAKYNVESSDNQPISIPQLRNSLRNYFYIATGSLRAFWLQCKSKVGKNNKINTKYGDDNV
eukprot:gene5189-7221_t